MYSRVEKISPERAAELLQGNEGNRDISRKTVLFYVDIMKKGNWMLSPQGISISENGKILDGQHRLHAVVESGVTCDFYVTYNVKSETFKVLDTGRNRNLSDTLSVNSVNYSKKAASIITAYVSFVKNNVTNARKELKLSNSEGLEIYDKYVNVITIAIKYAKKYNERMRILPPSEVGAIIMYLHLNKTHEYETIFRFFDMLYGYEPQTKVISSLMKTLVNDLTATRKMPRLLKRTFIIKAWNMFITGRDVSKIRLTDAENEKDFF